MVDQPNLPDWIADYRPPRPWENNITSVTSPLLPADSPLWKEMRPRTCSDAELQWSDLATHFNEEGAPCNCARPIHEDQKGLMVCSEKPFCPKLWGVEPEGITHIAGANVIIFNIFQRQRCEWCGIVLQEYDLRRIAVRSDDPNKLPGHWEPGSLVRVDGHVSAAIVNPETIDGMVQLPMDCCAFDPKSQVK